VGESVDQRSRSKYRFGPFRVDAERELLLRDDQTIPLAPKAFQVLLVLIRSEKRLVTKEELLKRVWPDTFVEEANLSRNVFLLRKALGESPQDRQYVVTVPGRGYRFAEDVQFVPEEEVQIVAASRSTVEIEVKETRPWAWIWMVAAVVLVVGGVAGWRLFVTRARGLQAGGTLVLADFTNSTGDPVFEGTLRQGLATQLQQSPVLEIMDDSVLQRDLRLMKVPPGATITSELAHDVCVREGAAATIEASIARLGSRYAITLLANRCADGKTLAREQVQAEDKDHVLNALGSSAAGLRSKLGESLGSIEQRDRPLEQATTSSLEALKAYSTGLAILGTGHYLAAIPLFERAIAIDPHFTMAYYVLGVAYEVAGDMKRSAEFARQAFSLVDRVSENERIDITAYYYRATGELDKEMNAYRLAARNEPRKWSSYNQLALILIDMGRFEEGLQEAQKANQLRPDNEGPYRRQLDAYLCLNQFSQAHNVAAKVQEMKIDGPRIHQRFLELGYVENDQAAIARETQWFAGRPEEYLSLGLQAANLYGHGQRRAAHKEYQRAAQTARQMGLGSVGDEIEDADARAAALSGDCSIAHNLGRPAMALAMCGETARAEKLAAETTQDLPNGNIWNAVQLPQVNALVALNQKHPDKSVEVLASALPFERAYPGAPYVRGLAYLGMHKGTEAVTEFRKIVDHKGASWGATWVHPDWGQYYSLAYLGLARGYAMAGDTAQAKQAFEQLFAWWKDGDRDTPVFLQAKAEYGRLR
jgi:eukaryotic-like serine/threonine-protein kinase